MINEKRNALRSQVLKKIFFLVFCVVLLVPTSGLSRVKLGQSCAMTGPASFLGQEMNKGAAYYFSQNAPNVQLIVKDDGYEPGRCRLNTQEFIKNKVNALFGYVGTPTSKVAVPLAEENKTIFFGAFTGASFLSDIEKFSSSFSVRSTYNAEIENMLRRLRDDLGITKVALFVQRDAFGLAGIKGAMRADKLLKGISIVPALPAIPKDDADKKQWRKFWSKIPNYRRNTVAVGKGVRQAWGSRVEAIIFVGAYTPCAAAINKLHEHGFKGPVINISFVGSKGLAKRLKQVENVYISQVVPNPWDATIPVVNEYQKSLGDDQFSFVSLEGYIAAKIFDNALKSINGSVDYGSIKNSLEKMSNYDLGGITISFSPDDHRGMDSVYLTSIYKSGKSVSFNYVNSLPKSE